MPTIAPDEGMLRDVDGRYAVGHQMWVVRPWSDPRSGCLWCHMSPTSTDFGVSWGRVSGP